MPPCDSEKAYGKDCLIPSKTKFEKPFLNSKLKFLNPKLESQSANV